MVDELIRVRWSIFISISVCAGLPALVWSARFLIHHRRNGHRISAFIILLLLTDFIELFLSPYILIKLHLNELSWDGGWTGRLSMTVWSSSRFSGLLLTQLVVLERILSVKYPLYVTRVFFSNCFICYFIILFLCNIISFIIFLYLFVYLLLIVSVVVWIVSCCALLSHTSRKPDPHILVIFIFNMLLLVLHLPLILLIFLSLFPLSVHVLFIPCFLMSMRLISDPLLCVLVCRQNLRFQTSEPDRTSSV